MNSRIALVAATLVTLLAGCGAGKAPEAAAVAAPAAETLATTKQVMLGITIPTSDVLFKVGDNPPKDDAGWDLVVANALALGESGNLLLTGTRNNGTAEWAGFANKLIAQAKVAAAAAQAKDVDKVLDAGNDIYETCDGCHAKYMPARAADPVPAQ